MTKPTEVTVAQLIAHLQTLPQEAIVHVGKERTSGYDTWMEYSDVALDTDVFDYSDEQYRKSKLFGKCYVNLEAQ